MNTAAINGNLVEYNADAASFTPCALTLEEQLNDAYASLQAAKDMGWSDKAAEHLETIRSLVKQISQPTPLRCRIAA